MKNAYPSVAPSPTSEQSDDDRVMDFKPNGDDTRYYNLGHGNRRIRPIIDADQFLSDIPEDGALK